jgi:outer membrane protein OmpA-like peptidoglycan-associated protein
MRPRTVLALLLLASAGCSGTGSSSVPPPRTAVFAKPAEPRQAEPPRNEPQEQKERKGGGCPCREQAELPAPIDKQDRHAQQGPTATITELERVEFPENSERFTRASSAILDQLAQMIKKSPGNVLRIEGHSDRTEKNTAVLSLKRARYVRHYLIAKGVPPQRLKAVGLGATQPVAPSDTDAGRRENRRVELSGLEETY